MPDRTSSAIAPGGRYSETAHAERLEPRDRRTLGFGFGVATPGHAPLVIDDPRLRRPRIHLVPAVAKRQRSRESIARPVVPEAGIGRRASDAEMRLRWFSASLEPQLVRHLDLLPLRNQHRVQPRRRELLLAARPLGGVGQQRLHPRGHRVPDWPGPRSNLRLRYRHRLVDVLTDGRPRQTQLARYRPLCPSFDEHLVPYHMHWIHPERRAQLADDDSSRGGEHRPGRCPPLWPGDLQNDGGKVATAGADRSEA